MGSTSQSTAELAKPLPVNADVIGGAVLMVLAVLHLFLLQVGGLVGVVLLLFVWPLVGGGVAAYLDHDRGPDLDRELTLTSTLAGVFGAVTVTAILLFTGIVGVWSGFIYRTFGSELISVTVSVFVLLTICWSVSGFVAGYAFRQTVD